MQRRRFLALSGMVAVAPVAVTAQAAGRQVIGFLSTRAPDEAAAHTAAFIAGLRDAGLVVGRDVEIDYRWARGDYALLPKLANELVKANVAVIAAGGDPSAIAAKAATEAIPIAFLIGDDPVRLGLVPSLNRPGATYTGVSMITSALGAKRLEILCELAPGTGAVGLVLNPTNPNAATHRQELEEAAAALARPLAVVTAATAPEIDAAFARLAQQQIRLAVVENDPFFDLERNRFVALAARHAIAGAYHIREFVEAGGLMSFGPDLAVEYRSFGSQTGRMLLAPRNASLPVMRPTRFELVVNQRAAKALGLAIPPALLARADEVIE